MNIRSLNGKKIAILGYGREGKAMAEALERYAPDCEITIADENPKLEIRNSKHRKQLGEGWLENLNKFDVIIKSPGIPWNLSLTAGHLPLTNSTQIFLDSIDQDATVIGVTGSKGKSTTSSLIHAILKAAGKDVLLLGNIGDAAIAHIEEVKKETIVVMELSSYQLMQLTRSPQIAVITSFFPEHLDYHGTLEAYRDAKKHICSRQKKTDCVFYQGESSDAKEIADASSGKHIAFFAKDSPVLLKETHLIGEHNASNIAGAAAVSRSLGIDDATIARAVRNFTPLPHRLQNLGTHHGILWVDDAISTTPESAIAALAALSPNVKTLILGGQDRGNDFSELGGMISASGIETVILMGASGTRIANAISGIEVRQAKTMDEAVRIAKGCTPKGSICLLSPASPSYDMYANFEEKGRAFADAIKT